MLFQEELKEFNNTHRYQVFETENGAFRYIISGDKNVPPIILFNGLEIQETWIRYVKALEKTFELLWDGAAQEKFSTREFEPVKGNILLLQPSKDIFTSEDQKKLADLLPGAAVKTMRGGHLSVIMCAEEYIREIREFLKSNADNV